MDLYVLYSVLIGFLTGLLSGVFGIGGALLSTPAIRLILNVKPLIAVGTPLPVIIPTATTAGIVYFKNGLVEKEAIFPTATAGIFGAMIGASSTALISGHYLLIITAVLIFAVGVQFIYGAVTGRGSLEHPAENNSHSEAMPTGRQAKPRNPQIGRFFIAGLIAGLIGGLLGIGGGVILIPLFVFWLKIPLKKAFGTSLITISIMALPGSLIHYLLGHVDVRLAILLMLGVVPGSYAGARITYLAREKGLAIAFGLVIIGISVFLGINEALLIL